MTSSDSDSWPVPRIKQSWQLSFSDCAVIGQLYSADHVTHFLLAGLEVRSMVTWWDRPMAIQKICWQKGEAVMIQAASLSITQHTRAKTLTNWIWSLTNKQWTSTLKWHNHIFKYLTIAHHFDNDLWMMTGRFIINNQAIKPEESFMLWIPLIKEEHDLIYIFVYNKIRLKMDPSVCPSSIL